MSANDDELICAVVAGDRAAFEGLVRRYQDRLYGLMVMMLRRTDAADEVTQDAFVRAFKYIGRFDAGRPFYPWLAAIAVRLAHNRMRASGRMNVREGTPLDAVREPDLPPLALSRLIANERGRRLWQAVASLSSAERTVVLLYYRDDLSVGQIGQVLGVTAGTVKTFLFRARKRLRERLDGERDTPREATA